MVFDARLEPRLTLPASVPEPSAADRALLEKAMQTRGLVFSDLHRDDPKGPVHLDIAFPIFAEADTNRTALAAALLKSDARQFLFPLVQSWPVPSRTAETLLVRREDDEVLYLNELRHRPETALTLRIALATPDLPAAKVLRGDTNVVEGVDYRGVPVVAAGRSIPGTAWALVAKMDREEIYGPLRQRTLSVLIVLGALLVASALLVALLWRQRSAHVLQRELAERAAHGREMERMTRLYAALSQVNQAVVRANSRDELLREICRVLVDFGGVQMAWVGWVDHNQARVFPLAQYGDGSGHLHQVEVFVDERAQGSGAVGIAIREGRPQVCNDLLAEPGSLSWRRAASWRSLAAFPIRQEGQIRGALAVYSDQKEFFGAQEKALIEEAAADVSFGLDILLNDERRKQAEAALRDRNAELDAERARWQGVVEGIADEVWMCDAQGRMSLMNLPAVTNMGLTEFKDKDVGEVAQVVEIMNPDGRVRPDHDAPLLRSLRGEIARGEEIMVHRQTGKRRWRQFSSAPTRDATGAVTGAVAIVRDITEQRRTEEALRRTDEQLRLAALAGDIGVWFWTPGTNEVVVSANWRRLFGVDAQAAVTFETWRDALHVEDRERAVREINGASAEHRDFNSEYRVVRQDGSIRWIVDRGRASYDDAGQPVGMAGVNLDITERKLAEEALRQARDDLARANAHLEQKVAERTAQLAEANANLQAFAYTAAHDLRSPLRYIRSFSSMVVEDCGAKLGPDGQSLLERVVASAEQMDRLLSDLLEYSKMSQAELKLEPLNLLRAVNEALALLDGEIRGKNALVRVTEPLPEVLGHLATVVLLINNLVSNALKFTPPGVQPEIRIGAEAAAGYIRLWVQDNGIGIAPEHLEKVFGAFQRLHGKNAYPGTGLGLTIVREGAERMGGRAGVESEPGKGSRFWIELKTAA